LPDYVFALRDSGQLGAAVRAADEAIALARETGDSRSELRAGIQRARAIVVFGGADDWREEARSTAERAIEVFEAPADDGALADAWILLGLIESLSGNGAAAVAAHRRAREHARAAGDDRREREIWDELGGAMLFSRTPLAEVLAFGDEELAWAKEKGFPFPEADGSLVGGYVYPMLGRFEEGRERVARAKAIFEELGVRYNLAEAHWAGAFLELLAHDLTAAERELLTALRIFEEMGGDRYVPMVKARLAHVLHAQGRDSEALVLIDEARRAQEGDTRSGAVWRTALAKVLADRGETAEALGYARDAIALLETSDRINDHADALCDLAGILEADGAHAESTAALTQALTLFEEKGNRVRADETRAALAERREEESDVPA
jgi:tetratricopeptide (TPR) repeat protein